MSESFIACPSCKVWRISTNERGWQHCYGGHVRHCGTLTTLPKKRKAGKSLEGERVPKVSSLTGQVLKCNEGPVVYWEGDFDVDYFDDFHIENLHSTPFVSNEASDEFCRKEVLFDEHDLCFGGDSEATEVRLLSVQNKILKQRKSDCAMVASWKEEKSRKGCDRRYLSFEAVCLLNAAMVENHLSIASNDKYLDAFRQILNSSGVQDAVFLPVSSRAMKEKIRTSCDSSLKPVDFSKKLSDILGIGDFDGEAVGCHFDIMSVLADEMLSLSSSEIFVKPDVVNDENGQPIRSSFASGEVFCELSSCIREDYGVSTFCLPIAVSVDDTAFGGLRNRSSCPVYIKILSLRYPLNTNADHVRLVGFCPRFNKTDSEIKRSLKRIGVKFKGGLDSAIRFLKRSTRAIFIHEILRPLLTSARYGTKLKMKDSSIEMTFVPLVAMLALDSKQAYEFCSLNFHRFGNMNCRTCDMLTAKFWDSNAEVGTFRYTHELEWMCKNLADIERRRIRGGAKCLDAKDEKLIERGKHFNVIGFLNPLFELFRYQASFRPGILSLNEACGPDSLHTILRGPIEEAFRWSMAVGFLWGDTVLLEDTPRDPIAELDVRAKRFLHCGPFHVVGDRSSHLKQGFSYAFRDTNTSAHSLARGVLTGGCMDAQRIVQFLYQFCLNIGIGGSVVPNKDIEFTDGFVVNPTEVVLDACLSALELYFLSRGDVFTEKTIDYLGKVVEFCNRSLLKLFKLKAYLLGLPDWSTKSPDNIKPHLCTHLPQYVRAMGCPRNFDTDMSEHNHIKDVHLAAKRTGNRADSFEKEMLLHNNYVRRTSQLKSLLYSRKGDVECDDTRTKPCFCGPKVSDVTLRYLHDKNKWSCPTDEDYRRMHLHPAVELAPANEANPLLAQLTVLLDKFLEGNGEDIAPFSSTDSWNYVYNQCKLSYGKYQLFNSSSCSHTFEVASEPEPTKESFTFVATNCRRACKTIQRRFDFAEVEYKTKDDLEETEFARIMGILSIFERVDDITPGVTRLDHRYYLPLIAWLTDAKASTPESRISPLPFLKYNIVKRTGQIYMQFIELASLALPSVGVHDPDHVPKSVDKGENSQDDILRNRFWVIPIGLAKKFRRGYTNIDAVYMFPKMLKDSAGESGVKDGAAGSIPKVIAQKQKKEYRCDLVDDDDVLSEIGD